MKKENPEKKRLKEWLEQPKKANKK